MKKPQKPPDFGRVWSDYLEKYNDLANRVNQKNEESEEIRKLIRKYNEQEYIHWDDLRRKKIPFDPITFWFVIRTIRSTKYREIRIGNEKFPFYTPENFQKQLHHLDKASPASFDWLFGEFPSEANKNQVPSAIPLWKRLSLQASSKERRRPGLRQRRSSGKAGSRRIPPNG